MRTADNDHPEAPTVPELSTGPGTSAGTPVTERAAALAAPGSPLERALEALLDLQHPDGHWVFDFEADCTIPAEYVLLMHYLGDVDEALQAKLATYIRRRQVDGGWPLYHGGATDLSCSVKAYWALKLAGDDPDAPHMRHARETILALGGAERSNGFTRSLLARFGLVPWRAAPFAPVELMLLPRWLPLHFSHMSYWARAVLVPMTVLHSLKVRGVNPSGIDVRELFVTPPEKVRRWGTPRSWLNRRFLEVERLAHALEGWIPGFIRRRALRKAERWFVERLNGVDGLGGVFPSMVNALQALIALGHPADAKERREAAEALRRLVVERTDEAFCQPCLSPIWDTALAGLAIHECRLVAGDPTLDRAAERAGDWLCDRQVTDGHADWRDYLPDLRPGGWPFQYANDHYPDIDDACAVLWALWSIDRERFAASIELGADWVRGMQSSNGGFAAFDVDNDSRILQSLPIADSGPLLDPPTADVSGRALVMFGLMRRPADDPARNRVLDYLLGQQEEDGCWFGRWGTNYIYGTWCVMVGLELIDDDPRVVAARRRAVRWLTSVQQADGGWGETNDSYADPSLRGTGQPSTSYQTAWALLALMADDSADPEVIRRGVEYLERTQRTDGTWDDPQYSAPGFPEVFYLRYTGYSLYFPLWALARYRRRFVPHGAIGPSANGTTRAAGA